MGGVDTVHDHINRLADEYRQLQSLAELYQVTASVTRQEMNADFCVVASEHDRSDRSLATAPREWTDTDNLLSPASLPTIAASQGQAYIIDDKSNVRSATEAETRQGANVDYPSIMWVPFRDGGFLLVGSREKAAFVDTDLERLRVISVAATLCHQWLEETTDSACEQGMAEEAGTFLVHDATNLLSVIHGHLKLAQDEPDASHFETIQNNLHRLEALVKDTATLLESGDHVSDVDSISLERTADMAWETVATNHGTLKTYPSNRIVVDKSRLCQLLENLFRNAIEHGGPDVTIRVGPLNEGEGFFVEDDGPGIGDDSKDSLFELGYSTDQTHTGVGLTIVQRIARAHGWEISITESENGGARFEFRGVDFTKEEESD